MLQTLAMKRNATLSFSPIRKPLLCTMSHEVGFITPHAQRERGKVIGCGVHIYIYVRGRKKYLNRTLEIDSPFQTFAVGLLVEFID